MIINKKKLLAVVTALILTILTASSFSTSADNSSVKYLKYNAKTGAYLGSYTLNSMPSSDNSRSIIDGNDNRVIDWSKSGVVKLITSDGGFGTGFVVDEHVIATAAHCLKGYNISEILLFNSDGTIAMHATPVEKHYSEAYKDAISFTEYANNDYGLITVKEDLSDYMFFNLSVPSRNINGTTIKITGFPEEVERYGNKMTVNSCYKHAMYTGSGSILAMANKYLYYDNYVTEGTSGGPVYITESYDGRQYYSVIAIHARYVDFEDGNEATEGTRMTFDLLHFYSNNDYINY